QRLTDYRQASESLPPLEESELLLAVAPYLEDFLAQLFGIERDLSVSRKSTLSHDIVLAFKKEWVLRRGRRYRQSIDRSFSVLDCWLNERLTEAQLAGADRELAVAQWAQYLQQNEVVNE